MPGLALVIHADIPKNRDILLHRSGRTGRAGSKGISALIVPHNARRRAEIMLKNARVQAAWGKPPSIEDILERDRERFLANPAFGEPVKEGEKSAVAELLSRYQPEQIAAALIRLHHAQKPAPEELLDAAPVVSHAEAGRDGNRDNFKNSVWVSLSVGHDMSAEPRWILPMLCGRGNITKRNIGAIKVHQNETHVELTAECADGFFKTVGEGGKIEKNIVVTRMQGAPTHQVGNAGSYKGQKKYDDRKPRHEKAGEGEKQKHPFKKKHGAPKPHGAKPGMGKKHKPKFRDK
jgi:ATP-dependent RNA helicase DeaD